MGRPLRKDVLGTDVIGTPISATGLRVEAYYNDTAYGEDTSKYPYILKQRGAKTFVIANTTDSAIAPCVLQSAAPSANGQMRIVGHVGGNGGAGVAIAKLTKRVATAFDGTRYTWVLDNDSSNDYLLLTPIA